MVQRKRGAVVSIGSSSGWFPMGLLSMYSATKAYVDFLSLGLAMEYASKGMFCVRLCSHVWACVSVHKLFFGAGLNTRDLPTLDVSALSCGLYHRVRTVKLAPRSQVCGSNSPPHAGIDFQCVMPMFVTSKLSKIRKPTLFVPSPTTFARSAVCLSRLCDLRLLFPSAFVGCARKTLCPGTRLHGERGNF